MNSTDTTQPSTAPAATRSKRWRITRFCLLGLATVITLFALYHVEENWRGKRAWNKYKEAMEAKGAVFEVEKLAPPPVPDDQNFAMTPLLKPLLDLYPTDTFDADGNLLVWKDPEGKARAEAITVRDQDMERSLTSGGLDEEADIARVPDRVEWRLGERLNLADWQRYYALSTNFPSASAPSSPAEAVLKALSRYDAELAELKQASQRPYSRFNIRYEDENPMGILLSHLPAVRRIARVVQLRALAELESGNIDAAFEDVELLFSLADSIQDEPFLISHLVRIVLLKTTASTVWEGMADHQWTSAQLAQFQQRFLSIDLVKSLKQSFEAERTFGTEIIELAARDPSRALEFDDSTGAGLALNLVPRGWWCLEAVNLSRAYDHYILAALPDDPGELDVQLIQSRFDELETLMRESNPVKLCLQHRIIIHLLLPALDRAAARFVEGQALVGMAAIATALERYYLENQSYPEDLSALAPDSIRHVPNDPVTHEAFRYERTANDSFQLWSAGWNGVDDGGEVFYEIRSGERRHVSDQLDWVWPSVEGLNLREKTD